MVEVELGAMAEPHGEPERGAVAFARLLRAAGLDVPVGSATTYAEALAATGVDRRQTVYWAGRTTLIRRPEDVPTYDAAFAAFWLRRRPLGVLREIHDDFAIAVEAEDGDPGAATDSDAGRVFTARFSRAEVLRNKDFAVYTHAEFDEARKLMADLRLHGALRRSRRLAPSARRGLRPDLRRTVRSALRTGGEPVRRMYREHSQRPRRIVLLCDVSGSMDPYARALVRFLHAAVVGRGRVEAFALGTRLTRLTRELQSRDADAAIRSAAAAVHDWSGGTRLGDGLKAFNDRWGVRGMARGAIVVVLSDGLDRGDPTLLAEQTRRLQRVAHRLVWVNPLKSATGYAPLARGMAAALPYVDEFVEGHSLASLEALAAIIARP